MASPPVAHAGPPAAPVPAVSPIAQWRDDLPTDFQPTDATLTALAALTTAADQVPYSTGVDTFAMAALTAFGRTLIGSGDATAAGNAIGAVRVSASSMTNPGYIRFQFGGNSFQVAWGIFTANANGHTNVNYHTPFNGFSIPALSTRRVETDVELKVGQSFVIAGLLDDRVTENLSRVPGLASVPFFGQLFRSRELKKAKTELVVLVTPTVHAPGESDALPLPVMPVPFIPQAAPAPAPNRPSAK